MKETKEKIIRQALEYFTMNDYQGASLNSIARAIGITKGVASLILISFPKRNSDIMVAPFLPLRSLNRKIITSFNVS